MDKENATQEAVTPEQIRKCATYEKALKLYLEGQKQNKRGSGLQRAVAEVALKNGKVELATQFTILAGQTENVEKMEAIALHQRQTGQLIDEAANVIKNGVQKFTSESVESLLMAVRNLGPHMEMFERASSRLADSSGKIEGAASQISRAASQMGR